MQDVKIGPIPPRHLGLVKRLDEFDKPPPAADYATKLDAWVNSQTGIGTSRDKVTATGFSADGILSFSTLDSLYHNDDVAARICNQLPGLAFRKGFTLSDPGLWKDMEALDVCGMFEDSATAARAYGGGACLVGCGGPAEQPAVPGRVTSLVALDRFALSVWDYYRDSSQPKYGQPMTYKIWIPQLAAGLVGLHGVQEQSGRLGQIVHESRLIFFPGAHTLPRKKIANGWWDDSVLQRCYQVVQAYGLSWASVVHLLQDMAQGVYSMKELWAMIAGGNKDLVEERMKLVDEQRSSAKMILVDADNEKFERVKTPLTGLAELIDRMTERLASAAETPLTVLMGSSPKGMNATGQSDLEIWYGRGEKYQTRSVAPAIKKLALLMGKDVTVTFPPLWSPTAKEVAETRYITAQADNIYLEKATYSPDEIRTSRYDEAGNWTPGIKRDPKITAADLHVQVPAAAPAADGTVPAAIGAGASNGDRRFSPKYGR